jgi:hypothetical protein
MYIAYRESFASDGPFGAERASVAAYKASNVLEHIV